MYPIKSLRPTAVEKAVVLKTGFSHDRRFMVLKVQQNETGTQELKNMAVAHFAEMTLFLTSIKFPVHGKDGEITVTFCPPNADKRSITIPLEPDTSSMPSLDVTMHGSYTKAYDMESHYNDWFSECFGYPVVLAYLGQYLRPVLFPKSPNEQSAQSSWFYGITKNIPLLNGYLEEEPKITFADCAPFLVVTEDSLLEISARLPEGETMDITKYRPNIVLAGADKAWDEDFWAEIQIGEDEVAIPLQHNCIRCQSINVDYATGKPGQGASGKVLKLMQKDRRVDKVQKYSPVFGRYGFLSVGSVGKEIGVGDEVIVTKRNSERTGFGELYCPFDGEKLCTC
jgi:uncharacterized protein YcbX